MSQGIFLPEPPLNSGEDGKSASCPASLSPLSFMYGFLILFNWNEDIKTPFKIFPRRAFQKEISDNCVVKKLTNLYRIKPLKALKSLPGQKMSVFAKIESSEYIYHFSEQLNFRRQILMPDTIS